MKKQFQKLLLIVALMLTWTISVQAQNYNLKDMPPLDPKVRAGVLANGMHYFIRANSLPEKRGEFYIANNIGAIQENDDQNGLAHFTEHMSFNGTGHFPKKGILDYLATIGVKFGTNVNASTGLEQTVFNLSNVPLTRETITDSCLLILRDWAHYVAFEDTEIDLERGVILEEWRMYGSASERMSNKLAPVIYKGSKYADRNVIGDTAVIKHFKYQTIKDFYHTWYRPDLQAIIIVGDFDVNRVEAKIKEIFSEIPIIANAKPKVLFPLADNQEPLIGTATDKEATNTMVTLTYKHDAIPDAEKNLGYMRTQLVRTFVNVMLSMRLMELARNENPPFMFARGSYSRYTSTRDAFNCMAQAKENNSLKALSALVTEVQRMKLYGFNPGEYDRAKAEFMRSLESRYMDRDKRKNRELVRPITSFFLTNSPNPGIDYEYAFDKAEITGISLEEINAVAKSFVTDNNMIVTITGPEKEGITLPAVTEIGSAMTAALGAKITPYVDNIAGKKLIEKEPSPGKVTSTASNPLFGTTEWTLSNGMKVIFKPTDIKEDELNITGWAEGGASALKDEDLLAADVMGDALSAMGLGSFSRNDLTKLLAGKRAGVSFMISDEQDMVSARTSPKDLETALQLMYLSFTSPRWNETDYKTWYDKLKESLINADAEPRKAFSDTIEVMVASHNKRVQPVTYKSLDKISFDLLQKVFKQRFSDPGNFTLLFTGKVNPEAVKPLVEKYLASLPNVAQKDSYVDRGIRPPKGHAKRDFQRKSTTPRTSIYVNFNGKCDYTADSRLLGAAMRHILELRYIERIREDEGGAYSVRVTFNTAKLPDPSFSFIVTFETDPLKADKLIGIVHAEVEKILKNGPADADLQKFKEYALKQRPEDMKENNWWNSIVQEYYTNKLDYLSGYETKVKALNTKAVQDFAKKALGQDNVVEVLMRP
ncbi:MAG: insulinase family protein [Bacteroidetes bacterium]|nr:insulinase family protein [Bacteroidota bacterium]